MLRAHLLRPLTHVKTGIEQLRAFSFEVVIPIEFPDELGQLSQAFNLLAEDLKDLEVGRSVQNVLFPTKPLVTPEISVFGKCVSASRMSGDYFDYLELENGSIGFILGDVSGHGVGAALVMAMAKAVMKRIPPEAFEPAWVLAKINRVIRGGVQRKKLMTCIVGVLSRDKMVLANAGQSYPLIIHQGECKEGDMPSCPLGIKKKITPPVQEIAWKPGDCLVCYTDGVVEAIAKEGRALGYIDFRKQ